VTRLEAAKPQSNMRTFIVQMVLSVHRMQRELRTALYPYLQLVLPRMLDRCRPRHARFHLKSGALAASDTHKGRLAQSLQELVAAWFLPSAWGYGSLIDVRVGGAIILEAG
jgi:hypothetical protein